MTWTPASSSPITHCPGALLHPPERTSDGMPRQTRGGSSKTRHRGPEGIPTQRSMSSIFTTQHLATRYAKWFDFERKHLILSLNLDKFVSSRRTKYLVEYPKKDLRGCLKCSGTTSWGKSTDADGRRSLWRRAISQVTTVCSVLCMSLEGCIRPCTVCTHLEHKFTFCHRGRSCNGQDRLHNSSLPQTQAGRAKADQKTPGILLQQDTRPLHPPSCPSHLFRALCSLHPPFQCRYLLDQQEEQPPWIPLRLATGRAPEHRHPKRFLTENRVGISITDEHLA